MVWMGAGRPPGPGSWEASDARETNSQQSPLSAKLPFCFLSNHHQQPATNIIQPRQAKVDNKLEYLRIPKQRVTSFIHCNGLVGRQRVGRGPASHLLRKLAHSVSSSANCHVTRVQLTPGGGSTVCGECSRGACPLPRVPAIGVKAKGDKNAACRKSLPLSPSPLKAPTESQ